MLFGEANYHVHKVENLHLSRVLKAMVKHKSLSGIKNYKIKSLFFDFFIKAWAVLKNMHYCTAIRKNYRN